MIDAELKIFEDLYKTSILPINLQQSLHAFLLSCYTGMRHGDLRKFTNEIIVNNVIEIQQGKTGEYVHIPLIPKARELLKTELVVLSNQKMNFNLHRIQNEFVQFKKPLTCHIARHTFATIGLNCGVPLEVVSEVLGHKLLSVTRIYAKMNETYKIEQMEKWGV